MNTKNLKYFLAILSFLAIYGCDKSKSPEPIEQIAIPKVVSKWLREERKDPFDDSVFLRYSLTNEGGDGSAFLLADCNKKKELRFNWQYGGGEKGAPYGAMDMKIEIRLDSGPVVEQEWVWSASAPLVRPKDENHIQVLDSLVGKTKVALRETITQTTMIFDITGFDDAYADLKKACSK